MGLKSMLLFRGRRQSSEKLLTTPPRGTPNRKGPLRSSDRHHDGDDGDDDEGNTSLGSLPKQLKLTRRLEDDDDDVSSIHIGESVYSPPQVTKALDKSKSELSQFLPLRGKDDDNPDDDTHKVVATPTTLATTMNTTSPQDPFSSWLDSSKTAVERLLSFGSDNSKSVMDQLFSIGGNNREDDTATVFLPAGGEASSVTSQPSSFASTAGTNYTERAGNTTKKKDVLTTLICLSLLECSNEEEVMKKSKTRQRSGYDEMTQYKASYASIPERLVRASLRRQFDLSFREEVTDGPLAAPLPPRQQSLHEAALQSVKRRKSLPVSVDDDLFEVDDKRKVANYAEQCLARHEYTEAVEIYRTLWKKQRETNDATSVAHTLTKLAILTLLVGQLNLAMKYSKAALKIYRQEARPGQVAMSLMQVGMIYFAANRLGPALKSWREALHLVYKAMGYDNTNIPILLNNIGCLHLEAGDLTSSLKTLEESLDLQRSALSASTSDTNVSLIHMSTTMCNIAIVSAKRLEMEVAIGLLEEARALQESVLPSEHHALIQLTTTTLDRIMDMRDGTMANGPAAAFALQLLGRQALGRHGDDSDDPEFDTATFSTGAYPLERVDSTSVNRSASVFGDGDGIPMRRGFSKSLTTTMTATDNLDFLLLGPLANELTLEQRVRECIRAGFGRTLSEDVTRRLPFVPRESASRRRLRIPVDIDGVVLDAELHLQGINAQAMEHLDVSPTTDDRFVDHVLI
jgi:tetratricopeptide (TPR) repeat protein